MRLILIFWPLLLIVVLQGSFERCCVYSYGELGAPSVVSAPLDVRSDHLSLLKEVELFRARALQF